jgi:hypothetical protein
MLAEDVMPCILIYVRSTYQSALRATYLTNVYLLELLSERIYSSFSFTECFCSHQHSRLDKPSVFPLETLRHYQQHTRQAKYV